jgi:hypothetical protein
MYSKIDSFVMLPPAFSFSSGSTLLLTFGPLLMLLSGPAAVDGVLHHHVVPQILVTIPSRVGKPSGEECGVKMHGVDATILFHINQVGRPTGGLL